MRARLSPPWQNSIQRQRPKSLLMTFIPFLYRTTTSFNSCVPLIVDVLTSIENRACCKPVLILPRKHKVHLHFLVANGFAVENQHFPTLQTSPISCPQIWPVGLSHSSVTPFYFHRSFHAWSRWPRNWHFLWGIHCDWVGRAPHVPWFP